MIPYDIGSAQNHVFQATYISPPNPETSGSSSTKPKTKGPPRKHLDAAGQSILEEHWKKHPGVMPPPDVRNALLMQIKNYGNDFYTVRHLTNWFKRRITALSNQPPGTGRYPSLSKSVLDHLEILIKGTSNPTPDVIKTWAMLLRPSGAQYEDVLDWVVSRRNEDLTARLPTPANTVSPEPSLPPSSPRFDERHSADANVKQSPIASPMLLSPNLLPDAYPSISRREGHKAVTHMSPASSPVNNNSFAHQRQNSVSSNVSSVPLASPTSTPPSSATQPECRFVPFEQWPRLLVATPQPTSAWTATSSYPQAHVRNQSHNHASSPVVLPPPPPVIRAPMSRTSPAPAAHSSPARPFSPERNEPKQQQEYYPKPRNSVLQAIIEGFAEAPANPTRPPAVVPTSSAEYQAMFAAYEKQLNNMRQVLEK